VAEVQVTSGGLYSYRFNWHGNVDLGEYAQERGEIYWVEVWNPADITPAGPRGFDVTNPRAWYQPAKEEALAVRVPRRRGARL
jgi:hypothetical protein